VTLIDKNLHNIGTLVQSITDSLHHTRRQAGTVACDRLVGKTLFSQGGREKIAAVKHFPNRAREVAH